MPLYPSLLESHQREDDRPLQPEPDAAEIYFTAFGNFRLVLGKQLRFKALIQILQIFLPELQAATLLESMA